MDGYADLQDLYGVPLEFEIELLAVQQPEGFLKEPWEMSLLDKMSEAPQRKDEGNALYQTGDAKGALEKYTRALVLLENIMQSSAFQDSKREINQRKERREKEEWRRKEDAKRGQVFEILPLEEETSLPLKSTDIMALEQLDTSCRLNYAACQLKLGDYTSVIVQTSEVLSRSPRHLKALFRRGQAYLLLNRNLELASEDFKSLRKVLENKKMENSPEWMELLSMEKRIALEESKDLAKEKQLFSNMFLTSV